MIKFEWLKTQPLLWIILVAALMMLVLSFASPYFMTLGNMTNLTKQVSIVAILAAGQAIVIISGGIDLSVGSVLALSAVTIGWLIEQGIDPKIATVAGLAMGTFMGWINGMVITRGKIPPFIATLGMLGIARGMALVITKGVSYQVLEPMFLYIGNSKVLGLPIPLYFVVVVFGVVMVMMHMTVFGRHVYAIGGDERVARLEGIPVDRQKVKIYALSGFLAAVAAVVMVGRLAATPPSVAQGTELQAIAAVIIGGISFVGGRGLVITALVGAFIMAMITNGLNILGISSFYQQVLIGIVIIVAVWLDNLKSSAQ
ncbi:MAG: ABC transporter permease [Paracoccaceae bacterium]|nr:ABC transporter permease [Paracoccaceae bacterium]MDE2912692.1 ABC transporter permease [Paracoccaceae bacterium]